MGSWHIAFSFMFVLHACMHGMHQHVLSKNKMEPTHTCLKMKQWKSEYLEPCTSTRHKSFHGTEQHNRSHLLKDPWGLSNQNIHAKHACYSWCAETRWQPCCVYQAVTSPHALQPPPNTSIFLLSIDFVKTGFAVSSQHACNACMKPWMPCVNLFTLSSFFHWEPTTHTNTHTKVIGSMLLNSLPFPNYGAHLDPSEPYSDFTSSSPLAFLSFFLAFFSARFAALASFSASVSGGLNVLSQAPINQQESLHAHAKAIWGKGLALTRKRFISQSAFVTSMKRFTRASLFSLPSGCSQKTSEHIPHSPGWCRSNSIGLMVNQLRVLFPQNFQWLVNASEEP